MVRLAPSSSPVVPQFVTDQPIQEALVDFNPWWKGPFHTEYRDREVYDEIRKFMSGRQIVALTGLRRVGKTTLMQRIAEDAIRAELDARNILYFSFDEFRATRIREIVRAYEVLWGQRLTEGRHLLLFDEVQKVEGWEDQIKALYDGLAKGTKIVISGSESLFLRTRSKETLAGRMFEFRVRPLSFREYLTFRGIPFEPPGLYEKELSHALDTYIRTLGFPELVDVEDRAFVRKYVQESIVEKILYRDLPQVFRLRDPGLLESLLTILTQEPGQIVELSALSKEIGKSRQTVSAYLSYLSHAFLLRKLYNFASGRRKVERKLKKFYPAIPSVDLVFRHDEAARGRILEWLVVNELDAEFFWRDPYKNEVDVVVSPTRPVPIEVKYGKPDLRGLGAFLRKFKSSRAYLVSHAQEGRATVEGKPVEIIPAYKFLLRRPRVED